MRSRLLNLDRMAKRRRRRSGGLHGAARSAKAAPSACKHQLSACMKGRGGGRRKAGACLKQFNRCKTR